MSPGLLLIVRALHIVAGILWGGGIVALALFVAPSIAAAGPGGGAVMKQIVQVRKFPVYMMAMATLTVLSGILLMWSDAHGNENFMRTPFGRAIGVGALLALVAVVIGMGFAAPSARRVSKLMASSGGAPDAATAAEIQRLQARMGLLTRVAAALVFLAAVAMAGARYL